MDDDRFRAPGAPDSTPSPEPPAPVPAGPSWPVSRPSWPASQPDRPASQPDRPAPQPGTPASAPAWPPTPAASATGAPGGRGRGRTIGAIAGIVLAGFIVFSLGVSIGNAGNAPGASPSYSPAADAPDWRLLDEAYRLLDANYVDPDALDSLDLERGALVGMTESLDDRGHTGYLTPEEVKERDESLSGTFVGVGAVLDLQGGQVVLVRILPDSPAERAGLQAGEIIVSVDGERIEGQTVDDVVTKVRGPEGSEVTLVIRGTDGSTRTVTITRAKLVLPLVSWAFAPGTRDAVIRLESFSAGAGTAVADAIRAAQAGGADGIVLDLRGNPGGYVDEPVEVAGQFLEDGTVYLSVDRSGKETPHAVEGEALAPEIPLVVLVDDQTASSAEILTGALQDADRAVVVGVQTYGTGTVVNTYPLADGGAITIGTERWLTPKGRAIWREGLVPDQLVELPEGAALIVPDDFATLGDGGIAGTDDAQLKAALAALDRERADASRALDRAA